MQVPFADGVRNRRARRAVALDLIEEVEDETSEADDTVEPADLPSGEPALLLQKMESRLVRHHLANPDVLSSEDLRKLRYILNFARLADFEPGAAGPGRKPRTRGHLGGRASRAVAVQGLRRSVRTAARGA
jgi:hypothetical protein